jgi:hypothetical protein
MFARLRLLQGLLCPLLALPLAAAAAAGEGRLGRVALPNSGAPEAQEPFLRGLAALHSFFYDEAADAFRAAQAIDPGFALAFWGEAMTYNHPIWQEVDLAAGRGVLVRLAPTAEERAAKAPTGRERGYLAAVEALLGPGDKDERDRAYALAMRQLREAHPDDLEAAAFYALALQGLQRPGANDLRRQMESAAVAEEVFAKNPRHPGAAHYLIHAYDDPVHAPLGLRAARVYAEIAPAAHHALHMPSHIFVQLGMWDEAAAANRAAWEASVAWTERRGHPVGKRDFHSLSWLHYASLQRGRWAEAEAVLATARQAAEAADGGRPAATAALMAARHAVETGSVPVEVAAGEEAHSGYACAAMGGSGESPEAVQLFAAAYAAWPRRDADAASAASRALAGLASGAAGHAGHQLAIMARQSEALASLAAGSQEPALRLLGEAVGIEETLGPPSGPPYPIKPAHELYGEVLLELGRPAEARGEFERSLLQTPNRTASHRGAARAAAAQGDAQAASAFYARLAAIWHQADAGLPALAEARSFLAAHGDPLPAS